MKRRTRLNPFPVLCTETAILFQQLSWPSFISTFVMIKMINTKLSKLIYNHMVPKQTKTYSWGRLWEQISKCNVTKCQPKVRKAGSRKNGKSAKESRYWWTITIIIQRSVAHSLFWFLGFLSIIESASITRSASVVWYHCLSFPCHWHWPLIRWIDAFIKQAFNQYQLLSVSQLVSNQT